LRWTDNICRQDVAYLDLNSSLNTLWISSKSWGVVSSTRECRNIKKKKLWRISRKKVWNWFELLLFSVNLKCQTSKLI